MAGPEKDNLEYLISQYMDGQLTVRQEQGLRRRLEQDPALAEQWRQYQALDAQVSSVRAAALDAVDYAAQRSSIMGRLERKVLLEGPKRRVLVLRPAFWGAMAAAAAVVLGVSVGWRWLQPAPVGSNAPPLAARNAPLSVAQMRVVAPEALAKGEAVVKVSLPRLDDQAVGPRPRLHSPGRLPSGTVMVSIMPPMPSPDDRPAAMEPASFLRFEF